MTTYLELKESSKSDRELIEEGHYVPCRRCEAVLREARFVAHYCSECGDGFCSQHGNFARRGTAVCDRCGGPKKK